MIELDIVRWLVWGLGGTALLSTLVALSGGIGLTRMSIPYLLGTMFTSDRDLARLVGTGIHLINGWIFSLVYIAAFHAWGGATWWKGAAIGLVHGSFVLSVILPIIPAMHPRMASEVQGPTVRRELEPPGFLGLHYGSGTPVATLAAHLVFGVVLGAFYRP